MHEPEKYDTRKKWIENDFSPNCLKWMLYNMQLLFSMLFDYHVNFELSVCNSMQNDTEHRFTFTQEWVFISSILINENNFLEDLKLFFFSS